LLVLTLSLEGGLAWADIVPLGSYNFFLPGRTPPPASQTATDIKITAKAKDGTTFEQTFSFDTGTKPDSARDFILTALDKAGWDVKAQGALGITIAGTKGGSPITEVDGGEKLANTNVVGLAVNNDSSEGVKKNQAVVGEAYKFAFLQLDSNSTTLDQNGTLTTVLNGTSYDTPVSDGWGPSQLEQALFSTLQKANVPVSMSGGMVSVAFDASRNWVISTLLSLDASGLETETIIPELTAVPEPSTLTLGGLAAPIGLGCWWRLRQETR
jgi:hypothetical protein